MRRLPPTVQITLGLLLISCSILFIAQMTSQVFAGPDTRSVQLRQVFAQILAAQSAVLLQKRDHKTLQLVFEAARRGDRAIRSIAVRKADGSLHVKAGDHEEAWTEPPGERSTLTEILVPLSQGKKRWGRFEVTYDKPDHTAFGGVFRHPLTIVVLHFLILGPVFYWIYLRRALTHLDPSAVIPERVRVAFNTMTEGVVVLDRHGRVLMTNSAFDLLCASDAASIVGKKLSKVSWLTGSLPGDVAQHPWARAMQTRSTSKGNLLVINTPLSQSTQLMVNCAPILDPQSRVGGCMVTFDDVSAVHLINERLIQTLQELQVSRNEIERKNAELEHTATHDLTSGCFSRRAGMMRLSAAMQQANLDTQPLVVLMLDIDNFKAVNDGFGHGTGDKVIEAVGATLRSVVRETDVVARHGGDEFVVTMPGCQAAQAMDIAQSVRQAIPERCDASIAELAGFSVTVSIGLAAYVPEIDSDLSTLMHRADTALYDAKAAGRNTVVLAAGVKKPPKIRSLI